MSVHEVSNSDDDAGVLKLRVGPCCSSLFVPVWLYWGMSAHEAPDSDDDPDVLDWRVGRCHSSLSVLLYRPHPFGTL